ncbi:MAG: hypothetical protein NTV54_08780 [Ignavibacteriales bacterium]|nr:hypothetical protein [Ignavibacteriales bacterium]
MAEKKKFLLRVDGDVFASLEKWAADDLRSINAQIEFLLTDAVKKAKRPKISASNTGTPEQIQSAPEGESDGTI